MTLNAPFSNQGFPLIDLFASLCPILFLQRRPPVTQISPMLAVSDGNAAIKFYQAAFGAELLWHLGGGGHVVAGLSIDGAQFFLASEAPDYGTRGPSSAGFTTVRIELFVDDPISMHDQAVAAGAIERSPVVEHEHQTIGPNPIKRMLQGAVVDPFGHIWLVGKFLE
jgi:PhnB protein